MAPFISRKNNAAFVLWSAGVLSAAVQCVFLREYLAVFSGNELTVGLILSTWLSAMGIGSFLGARSIFHRAPSLAFILIVLALSGLYCIRASRLLFSSGELIGPLPLFCLLLLSEAPCAFASGYLFGALSQNQTQPANPYGIESFGALLGAFAAYTCILLHGNNITIVALASVPLARATMVMLFP
jgi:spermidine synthase